MNALELLRKDHEKLRGLFDLLGEAEDLSRRLVLFEELKGHLEEYVDFEDEMLFPLFQRRSELEEMIDDRYQENQQIRDLLDDMNDDLSGLSDEDEDSDFPDDLFSELNTITEEHLEAEENQLFPVLTELESKESLDRLGEELALARAS